jgi:hypothetical protein
MGVCPVAIRAICASLPTIPSTAWRYGKPTKRGTYAIADELDFVKLQLAQLPDRAYVCRLALLATCSLSDLIAAVALMLGR